MIRAILALTLALAGVAAPVSTVASDTRGSSDPRAQVSCQEDDPCWDWRTMGNRRTAATVTTFQGEVLEGLLYPNDDGTYRFVPWADE